MNINVEQTDLDKMYQKAEEGFKDCIAGDDREDLQSEIDVPLDEIVTKTEEVKIRFWKNENRHFILDIKLILLSPNGEKIGHYRLLEDETGECVDDYLVFD